MQGRDDAAASKLKHRLDRFQVCFVDLDLDLFGKRECVNGVRGVGGVTGETGGRAGDSPLVSMHRFGLLT
jgi:hypothetical protein